MREPGGATAAAAAAEPRTPPRGHRHPDGGVGTHRARPVSWRPGLGSRVHDFVNMAEIPLLFVLSVASMFTERVWVHATLIVYADIYFLSDTLWILVAPYIVKQPRSIIAHHLVAMMLLAEPTSALLRLANVIGECRRTSARCFEVGDMASVALAFSAITGDILVVELNTLFLLLRRNTETRQVFEFLFYLTWLAIRIIWYPYLLFWRILPHPTASVVSKASFVVIVLLQFWWTLAFLKPSYWSRQRKKFTGHHADGSIQQGERSPETREKYL